MSNATCNQPFDSPLDPIGLDAAFGHPQLSVLGETQPRPAAWA
jgi:hypothetical protein